jgi:hemerythrin-like domain-containing protein
MAIQIGAAEPGFNDPVGLLTACHRRIERFLGALYRIARDREGQELEQAESDALATALRYFRHAAPHHTADEEQGLFPAMTHVDQQASSALARLEQEHRRADELHAAVDRTGSEWLRAGRLAERQAAELQTALHELSVIYREHIRVEEEEVFPLARRVLSSTDLESIGRDMAARRGVPYAHDGLTNLTSPAGKP